MSLESALLAIFLLPTSAMVVIGLILRPFLKGQPRLSGYTLIAALTAAFGLAVYVLSNSSQFPIETSAEWFAVGDLQVSLGFLADRLTAIMLVVVTGVSLLVQIYSQGYMRGDPGYHRYFAFMALFTMSMLGLVLSSSLLLVFVFWEGVGLGSYLLIGFWFHRPSAAAAAKKAFIVTRFGDFGFLIGILILYFNTGTFDIAELNSIATAGLIGTTALTLAALGLFSGAAGKSAQFPLHTWLPDAMEGPTPVSSLIHAATMVAAGVYLVARMFPLFVSSLTAIYFVAGIGAFTAIFAASMALVNNDIKRVLAYSTISQLGFMMLGLGAVGVGIAQGHFHGGDFELEHALAFGVAVGIFHLFTHAFFKCLLFLGAGSVNHSTGTFDMRRMGGLRKYMPWTFVTFLLGTLALAGIWPLAGFWSKDEIVHAAFEYTPALFWLAIITVFMTAFYMFRAIFMTFGGEYRGGEQSDHGGHGDGKPHESPAVMVLPMVGLAILAVGGGWTLSGGGASTFLSGEGLPFFGVLTHSLPLISLAVALSGIFLAYAVYSAKWLSAERIGQIFAPAYNVLVHKYWFDELYERGLVGRVLYSGLFNFISLFDAIVVDGIVNGAAKITGSAGMALRKVQTGQLQSYGFAMIFGVLVIIVVFFAYR
ncbi:MAG: NADH-quinone oxidoreductase subunit L [Dehalococcoidia bacterium]|nr:NADH-quinone oxidoreductase subunit L [Dehalococcoidia bacterium]